MTEARTGDDVLTRTARAADLEVRYGDTDDHVVEVWRPRGPSDATPVLVIFLHGGFWRTRWDRTHARPLCAAIADAGYLVALPEYRRVGAGAPGGFPATFDDVAAVVDAVPRLVGGLERVVLAGHSAGGHLALWAAARHRLPGTSPWHRRRDPRLAGVVALAPVAELARADRDHVGTGAVAALMGGSAPDLPARYALADPVGLLPTSVPTVVVHGSDDQEVPVDLGRSYARAAARLGDPVTFVELPGVEHYGLIDPGSPAYASVLAAVGRCAGGPGGPVGSPEV